MVALFVRLCRRPGAAPPYRPSGRFLDPRPDLCRLREFRPRVGDRCQMSFKGLRPCVMCVCVRKADTNKHTQSTSYGKTITKIESKMYPKSSKMAPKIVPKSTLGRPWGAQGPLLEASSFFDPFWERFWLPFGLPFGSQ